MPFTRARIWASLIASTRPGNSTKTSVGVGFTVMTLTGTFISPPPCCGFSPQATSKTKEQNATKRMCRPKGGRRFSIELTPLQHTILLEQYRNDSVFSKRSEEHPSELQSLMRRSYAVFCLKKKKKI